MKLWENPTPVETTEKQNETTKSNNLQDFSKLSLQLKKIQQLEQKDKTDNPDDYLEALWLDKSNDNKIIEDLKTLYHLTQNEVNFLKRYSEIKWVDPSWGEEDYEMYNNMELKYGEQIFDLNNRDFKNSVFPYSPEKVKTAEQVIQLKEKYNLSQEEANFLMRLTEIKWVDPAWGKEDYEMYNNMELKYGKQIFNFLDKEKDRKLNIEDIM